jgi:hypothetical protein
MKPIKFSLNADLDAATIAAIDAELNDVNGKAIAFTVYAAMMVVDAAHRAERYLADHGVPFGDRGGAKVSFRPAGPTAKSYQYGAVSTEIRLRRRFGNAPVWYLDDVERVTVYPRNPERLAVEISDPATYNLVKRTLAAFGRDVVPRAHEIDLTPRRPRRLPGLRRQPAVAGAHRIHL